jgi:preprotein translocase subunit SecY
MNTFFSKITAAFKDKTIRNRIFFVIGMLAVFRILAVIPIPGVNLLRLEAFLANNQFFGVLNIFSGGGLSNLSIIMLGVGPYITASIIMQVLTILVPRFKEMSQEEGEAGRKKYAQYSRLLAVPLAILQSFTFLTLLERQGVLNDLTTFDRIINVVLITGGSMLLMWIGELISEYGIGNGVSIIIFAGIVSALPREVSQLIFTYDPSQLPTFIAFIAAALLIIAGVVLITEAERPIPVTYAKQSRGFNTTGGTTSTYIPLRLNQAGVIPIIFALSILLFPQIFANFFANSPHAWLASAATAMTTFLNTIWLYSLVYFVLVFVFTYFYTAVTFDPTTMSTNLQKNGAFIPGIRPGEATRDYVTSILNRITLVGALFLGLIAVLPLAARALTGITAVALGGTALLIVVSVVLDLIKKVDAQLSMREY